VCSNLETENHFSLCSINIQIQTRLLLGREDRNRSAERKMGDHDDAAADAPLRNGLFEACTSTSSVTPAALAAGRSGVLAGATSMMPSDGEREFAAEQAAYRARRVLPPIILP